MSTSPTLTFFEVGGCIRDEILGIKSKDVDFTVVGAESFDGMVAELEAMGFEIMTTKLETLTAVCKVPATMPDLLARTRVADFVMARKESSASTGRMPDEIVPGTLEDDLARRDFTVNAIARDPFTGALIDPHGGVADLEDFGTLRFVGDPMKRIREDALRVARGFRFLVTKGFDCDDATWEALTSFEAADLLSAEIDGKRVISTERLQVEMDKMFLGNTTLALGILADAGDSTRRALFPKGLRLSATMKA